MRSSKPSCSLAVEFKLINENILIQNEKITQVFVIQSEQDPLEWFGILFVDAGLYMGATVRFKILIDETYPDCGCPKVFFDPVPYHPLIEPETGELDTKNAFPDWSSTTHRLFQLLIFVKRVIRDASFYIEQVSSLVKRLKTRQKNDNNNIRPSMLPNNLQNLESEHTFNSLSDLFTWPGHTLDFLATYEDNQDEFRLRVEVFKSKCCQQLYENSTFMGSDRNAHTLVFTDWNPDLHEPVRDCVLAGRFNPPSLFAAYHKETDSVSFIPGDED